MQRAPVAVMRAVCNVDSQAVSLCEFAIGTDLQSCCRDACWVRLGLLLL